MTEPSDERYEIAYDNAIAAADERVEAIPVPSESQLRTAAFRTEIHKIFKDIDSGVVEMQEHIDAANARAERAEAKWLAVADQIAAADALSIFIQGSLLSIQDAWDGIRKLGEQYEEARREATALTAAADEEASDAK